MTVSHSVSSDDIHLWPSSLHSCPQFREFLCVDINVPPYLAPLPPDGDSVVSAPTSAKEGAAEGAPLGNECARVSACGVV
jgi:hypothetical protein